MGSAELYYYLLYCCWNWWPYKSTFHGTRERHRRRTTRDKERGTRVRITMYHPFPRLFHFVSLTTRHSQKHDSGRKESKLQPCNQKLTGSVTKEVKEKKMNKKKSEHVHVSKIDSHCVTKSVPPHPPTSTRRGVISQNDNVARRISI